MDRPFLMALVLAFLLLLLALMLFGWRRRQRRQASLPTPFGLPDDAGAELMAVTGFYVATTVAGEPLNRIAVAGLGYRSRAQVAVTERGLSLAIPGQSTIFIPTTSISSVEKATWTIDRVVEQHGMVLIRWVLGDGDPAAVEVDSYLRLQDAAEADQFFTTVQQVHDNASHSTDTPGGRAK